MRDENGFRTLKVRVGRHNCIASGLCLLEQRTRPSGELVAYFTDTGPNMQTEIGSNLLGAATGGVQVEAEMCDQFDEFELDEMMDVLGVFVSGDFVGLRGIVGEDLGERSADLRRFA